MLTDTIGTGEVDLARIAEAIGTDVAGPAADDVDRESRFPSESLAALKESRLLAALVPVEHGGLGASVREVSEAVQALARHCASSALVLGMHSIEVFNLVRYGTTPELRSFLEEVGTGRVLLANANSEVGLGGDVGQSICYLDDQGDEFVLDKNCLAVSFGQYADAIVSIGRRGPDSPPTDQVQVVCRAESLELEATSEWNTMGLRGTCSNGFHLTARIAPGLVFPMPFAEIANGSAFQARQLLLSAVWVGLAEAALSRAHAFVRAEARKKIGTTPPAAIRVAEMAAQIDTSRSLLEACASRFEVLEKTGDTQDAGFVVTLRNLKVRSSEIAVAAATSAVGVCGMAGFRRDTPFSLDRILRDAHGGLIMVNHDRILHTNAQFLLARKSI